MADQPGQQGLALAQDNGLSPLFIQCGRQLPDKQACDLRS